MNALLLSFLSASCAAFANFVYRRHTGSAPKGQSASGYLLIFYLFGFTTSLLWDLELWRTPFSPTAFAIGCTVGILNISVMMITGKALKVGPAGFTFAFQSASAVFPGILLFLIFGQEFGFSLSILQLLGMSLVLLGLYLGAKNDSQSPSRYFNRWLFLSLTVFALQILALTCIQGRCVLFNNMDNNWPFSYLSINESDDVWFLPGQFGTSLLLQSLFFISEKRTITTHEAIYGSIAGLATIGSSILLLLATKYALDYEKTLLFPFFAVATILLCSLWANRIYKEEFNLRANLCCASGILLSLLA